MICSAPSCEMTCMTMPPLDSPHERLAWAREQAGFADKADFARVAGVNPTTYRAYENGQNGFAKYAALFARKLGVTAEWLMEGGHRGLQRPPYPDRLYPRRTLPDDPYGHAPQWREGDLPTIRQVGRDNPRPPRRDRACVAGACRFARRRLAASGIGRC